MLYSFCNRRIIQAVAFAALLGLSAPALAAEQSFSDVPETSPLFPAVEYLRSQGIVKGYDDGTFKPDRKVNRAEALKMIIAPLVRPEQLTQATGNFYADIEDNAWYQPYAEIARQNKVIDGPPKKTNFNGGNPVIEAEFLKILELANGVDPYTTLSEISLPVSSDVSNVNEWYYPFIRYALASSMIMIGQDGLLHPGQELTRGDTAMLLFRFLMYNEGRRTQALLSETENEIIVVLNMLEADNTEQAVFASTRGLLAARGAHLKRPEESIVKAVVKISEAFRDLVVAYSAGTQQDYEGVVTYAGNAWNLAARAMELSEDLNTIGTEVQKISKNMADSAREAMGQPAQ